MMFTEDAFNNAMADKDAQIDILGDENNILRDENEALKKQVAQWAGAWLELLVELMQCPGKENLRDSIQPDLRNLAKFVKEKGLIR